MKIRTFIWLFGSLLIASFVALNLSEILRPTTLELGFSQIEAPLGLVLLGLLVSALAFFLVAMLLFQTGHLMALHQATKEAKEQRNLADKAEQSRFTELRQWLQTQEQQQLAREHAQQQDLWARLDALEQRLLTRMDEGHNGLAASLGELEDRLERQGTTLSIGAVRQG